MATSTNTAPIPSPYCLPPAAQLTGLQLEGGWRVLGPMPLPHGSVGGAFSYGYVVESADGEHAYLKALDLTAANEAPDPVMEMNAMTSAFLFERDLLRRCRDRHLSRVVHVIAEGKVVLPNIPFAPPVQYLILELADGDIRAQLTRELDLAWGLRALHHVAVGLMQLHGIGIAHQDMQPSNALVFDEGRVTKVGDLGRATARDQAAVHDHLDYPGDGAYAPPELLYGHLSADWVARRMGSDAYHLGSLIVFMFTGIGLTPLWLRHLDPALHPLQWRGPYPDVLPYVRSAFEAGVLDFSEQVSPAFREELTRAVRELGDPDPATRGHPKTRLGLGNPYSLERYVSLLDRLAYRAEARMLR